MKNIIAVIGASGFVGKAVCNEVRKHSSYSLVQVFRRDNLEQLVEEVDVIIYCATSSKRYFSEHNPEKDFIDSVEQFSSLVRLCRHKKIVLVSTVSCRLQLDTVYGRNRRSCELMLDLTKDLIVRLGPMYGDGLSKGALFDMINHKDIYISSTTRYSYTDVSYNARKILELHYTTGLIEIGAKNSIQLGYLSDVLNSESAFLGSDDSQIMLSTQSDSPDANEVIEFAKNFVSK